jgi:hypothetical protein
MVLTVIALAFFVLALLGILLYTVLTTRPDPQKKLRGGDAVIDAIDQYDRAQRYNWAPFAWKTYTGRMAPWRPSKNQRRHPHRKHTRG